MLYREDQDVVVAISKAHTIIAGAQTELWRRDVLKALHVAVAGGEVASQHMEDAEGDSLVNCPEVGLA